MPPSTRWVGSPVPAPVEPEDRRRASAAGPGPAAASGRPRGCSSRPPMLRPGTDGTLHDESRPPALRLGRKPFAREHGAGGGRVRVVRLDLGADDARPRGARRARAAARRPGWRRRARAGRARPGSRSRPRPGPSAGGGPWKPASPTTGPSTTTAKNHQGELVGVDAERLVRAQQHPGGAQRVLGGELRVPGRRPLERPARPGARTSATGTRSSRTVRAGHGPVSPW